MTPPSGQMLHIHPGDSSANALRESGIEGKVTVWCEVLLQGPLRLQKTKESQRERAAFLSEGTGGALSVDQCEQWRIRQNHGLLAYADYPETVLWFDACLYDQTILVYLLHWFAAQDLKDRQLSLLCVGEHPEFGRSCGLGELTPAQLLALLPQRISVTPAMFDLAQRSWRALCADTPLPVAQVAALDTSALPYLGEALVRFLVQFPAVGDGLSRLERECLTALDEGATSPIEVFIAASAAEPHPFFGDTIVWGCLNRLARAATPLLAIRGPEPFLPQWDGEGLGRWQLALTTAGRQVLAGEADAMALNGIDLWYGGTHLLPGNLWRWDRANRCLVAPK